jgi:chromosome segregation ATPase
MLLRSLIRVGLMSTLVGGSAVALLGSDQVKLYLAQGKANLEDAMQDMQGLETRLKLIRTQIRELDGEARELRTASVQRRVEVERLRAELEARKLELERQAAVLERASDLLTQDEPHYTIGQRTYSRAEVEQDAAEKMSLYTVQADTLKSLEETLKTKEKALELAAQNVDRAAALRVDLASKVELLEAQLQKLRAKEAFAATVDDLVSTQDLDSDLARARQMIADFEKEIEVKDRMLDEALKGSAQPRAGGIDYSTQAGDSQAMADRIRRTLGQQPPLVPAATLLVHGH